MKLKTLFAFALLMAVAVTSEAQFVKSLAVKGGISLAKLRQEFDNATLKTDSRTGGFAAVNIRFIDNTYWGINTDLGYIRKGGELTLPITGDRATVAYDYITFSPMLHFQYAIDQLVPYIFVGPRIDFMVRMNATNADLSFDDPELNKVSLGLTYGIGFEYKPTDIGIFLEGQHQPDFTKLYDGGSGKIKNNAFVICAGIRMYFGQ